jgi:hypothetical protein
MMGYRLELPPHVVTQKSGSPGSRPSSGGSAFIAARGKELELIWLLQHERAVNRDGGTRKAVEKTRGRKVPKRMF